MIILDGEEGRLAKTDTYDGLTLRHPQAAHIRSSIALPDYATSEAEHWKSAAQPKAKIDPRIWKGAVYSLGVYIFLSIVIVIPILVVKSRNHSQRQILWPASTLWSVESQDLPTPLQLSPSSAMILDNAKTCNIWNLTSSWNHSAKAYFSLPPTGFIAIRSNVTYNTVTPDQITGSLSVSRNQDPTAEQVLFTVDVQFSSQEVQQKTNVCFSRTGSNRGISIFVPSNLRVVDRFDLRIGILLPRVKSTVDNFVVILPMLTQNFDDLHPYPSFDNVNIEGAVRPITCEFLQAAQISIQNLAAPIKGTFNVTDSITLDSIKGSITSDITLTHQPSRLQPTLVTINTGDSAINTTITLHSSVNPIFASDSPSYVAKVANFNGPLDLSISSRNNSTALPFQLQVRNNLAKTSISLDATYQGSFSARTKLSQVTLFATRNNRSIEYDLNSGDMATGWTGFGPRPMRNSPTRQSYVEVVSALSPVKLTFGT
ncbi:hypothetical protein GALMADRAFT_157094 [Galerina marginata CBS 339.88]|uniref:Uncharacterized protein n=1 Tax=Galerina marginata (strain CBS 339.88) TaxID=685588 RepID=A0A067SWF6_GALM3|nr:hypothetical protein GALMADRAFT_157094 [Galerina marginata CBS 339.88]